MYCTDTQIAMEQERKSKFKLTRAEIQKFEAMLLAKRSEILRNIICIEDDTYGICQGNGEPIPKARLRAIPWARYCVEHANLREKGLKRKKIL